VCRELPAIVELRMMLLMYLEQRDRWTWLKSILPRDGEASKLMD
jgi:hypothetical protein